MAGFKDIIGHEQIIDYLSRVLKEGRVAHAYIISGPEGSGKRLLADRFAKAIQCEAGYGDSCNMCRSCLQMDHGNHPDVKYVTHEKQSIGIEDVRTQINNDVMIKPYNGRYKIYIIDEAEKLTTEAQNALLKTIEEPPQYAVIMLLTENSDLFLRTITSRCVALNLKPVPQDKIVSYLMQEYKIPDYKAAVCAAFSQGSVGKAVLMATSSEYEEAQESVMRLMKRIERMEVYEIADEIRTIAGGSVGVNDIIDMMLVWYRDVLILKATGDANLIINKDEFRYLKEKASAVTYEGLEDVIESMDKAKARLKANVNYEIVMELLLLKIKEN